MKLAWTLTATSYLDQLSAPERSKVLHAVERLPEAWDDLGLALRRVGEDQPALYALRVGADLRVVVSRRDDLVTVVDIVRRSQIDGLRGLGRPRQAAS